MTQSWYYVPRYHHRYEAVYGDEAEAPPWRRFHLFIPLSKKDELSTYETHVDANENTTFTTHELEKNYLLHALSVTSG